MPVGAPGFPPPEALLAFKLTGCNDDKGYSNQEQRAGPRAQWGRPDTCHRWTSPMNRKHMRRWMAPLALLALGIVAGCQVDVGGQTLPSPYYTQDDVQYFPPGTEFYLANEAAALEARVQGAVGAEQAPGAEQVPPPGGAPAQGAPAQGAPAAGAPAGGAGQAP